MLSLATQFRLPVIYLMREYGLDAVTLIATVEEIVCEKFGITENDLAETYTPAVHSGAKPEAL